MTANNLLTELEQALQFEVVQRHSYFQLKYFLIGKEPTNQAKMWQCLRELKSRKDSLIAIDLEIEDTKDKIELLDIAAQKLLKFNENLISDEFSKREREIESRKISRQKKVAENSLKDLSEKQKWIEEECRFFLDTFKNYSQIEPLRHFDDLESQKEYWTERLSQKLNLKMLSHNQLDTELIETIIALPDNMPVKQQILLTLQKRHEGMLKQLQETVGAIENKIEG